MSKKEEALVLANQFFEGIDASMVLNGFFTGNITNVLQTMPQEKLAKVEEMNYFINNESPLSREKENQMYLKIQSEIATDPNNIDNILGGQVIPVALKNQVETLDEQVLGLK